jgi:N-acetylmuramoyl-L-alanine amidase
MFKVYLDAGHYGNNYNKSTTGLNYYESAMTWKLAGYLKSELEKRNVQVGLSRQTIDSNPSLYNRGYGAKGYDLFLSLHSNACGTESVDYPLIIRGYDKSQCADFAQKIATLVSDTMGTKQAGRVITKTGSNGEYYGVLRGARAAGLTHYYIIEHSFHTNKAATQWLMSDANLRKLAVVEAELIVSYFNVAPAKTTTTNSSTMYRVRKTWADASSQIGAYSSLANAKAACKSGYYVFDANGKIVYPVVNTTNTTISNTGEFKVKIKASVLNIRSGAGTSYNIVGTIADKGVYTIVETKGNWGLLKSKVGWISISPSYVTRL